MGVAKIIHRIWFGPHPMRQELIDFGRSWERYGYEVLLWTEENLPRLVNQDAYDKCANRNIRTGCAPEYLGVWTQRADIVAYELIHQFGGIYANCDIEPLRDVHELLAGSDLPFCGWEYQGDIACNALFGGHPGNQMTGRCIDRLPGLFADQSLGMQEQTGPKLLTSVVHELGDQVTVYDQSVFYPFGFGEMDREWDSFPDSYTAHHWGHTRG